MITYEYTKICENIWQIEEDNSVCCTLVMGSEMAVLIDTGYGVRNLRTFVEDNITTPYIQVNMKVLTEIQRLYLR